MALERHWFARLRGITCSRCGHPHGDHYEDWPAIDILERPDGSYSESPLLYDNRVVSASGCISDCDCEGLVA